MQLSRDKSAPVVLYVDDDADDRMLFVDALQHAAPGYIVETANDGYQAMDFLNRRRTSLPCLVILDLNMPVMNGKELMHKLKNDEEFRLIPMVVFTTSSNPDDRRKCAQYGVDMLTKPINYSDLTRIVKQLLSYCKVEV